MIKEIVYSGKTIKMTLAPITDVAPIKQVIDAKNVLLEDGTFWHWNSVEDWWVQR